MPDANAAPEFYSKIENMLDFPGSYRSRGTRLAGRQFPNLGLDHAQSSSQSFRNRFLRPVFEGQGSLYPSQISSC